MDAVLPRLSRAVTAILAVALYTFLAHPAAGEIYRWTDAQGQLHFTSDLNQVPARYRDQVTAGALPESSISVLGDGPAQGPDERARATQERLRELSQQRKSAMRKQPAPAAPKADPEPRKYDYNCRKRTKNGRCQRFRTAAWDEWNKRQ